MLDRGLIPSTTGKEGGAKTGQSMNDYPEKDGAFIKAAIRLIDNNEFSMKWIDREAIRTAAPSIKNEISNLTSDIISEQTTNILVSVIDKNLEEGNQDLPKPYPIKSCYHCSDCNYSLWGKNGLFIICGVCNNTLEQK